MGFPLAQLQEELKHGSPHLRIILPAAAAVIWTIKRLVGHKEPEKDDSSHKVRIAEVVVSHNNESNTKALSYHSSVSSTYV